MMLLIFSYTYNILKTFEYILRYLFSFEAATLTCVVSVLHTYNITNLRLLEYIL